jgi:YHS domain-containing protein
MKANLIKPALVALVIMVLGSCAMLKNSPPQYAVDLVCNMKVQESEAYTYKYEGKKYFFDSNTCKESFKMNPKKFIENKCVAPK